LRQLEQQQFLGWLLEELQKKQADMLIFAEKCFDCREGFKLIFIIEATINYRMADFCATVLTYPESTFFVLFTNLVDKQVFLCQNIVD